MTTMTIDTGWIFTTTFLGQLSENCLYRAVSCMGRGGKTKIRCEQRCTTDFLFFVSFPGSFSPALEIPSFLGKWTKALWDSGGCLFPDPQDPPNPAGSDGRRPRPLQGAGPAGPGWRDSAPPAGPGRFGPEQADFLQGLHRQTVILIGAEGGGVGLDVGGMSSAASQRTRDSSPLSTYSVRNQSNSSWYRR